MSTVSRSSENRNSRSPSRTIQLRLVWRRIAWSRDSKTRSRIFHRLDDAARFLAKLQAPSEFSPLTFVTLESRRVSYLSGWEPVDPATLARAERRGARLLAHRVTRKGEAQ